MSDTERIFPINEETGLCYISCDDMCLLRFITRRDGEPPDDVEVADTDGNIDGAATAKARAALAAIREQFYAEEEQEFPEYCAELEAKEE